MTIIFINTLNELLILNNKNKNKIFLNLLINLKRFEDT